MGAIMVSGCSGSRGDIPDGCKADLACVRVAFGGFVRHDIAVASGSERRLGGDEVGRRWSGRRRRREWIYFLGERGF